MLHVWGPAQLAKGLSLRNATIIRLLTLRLVSE